MAALEEVIAAFEVMPEFAKSCSQVIVKRSRQVCVTSNMIL
jgi:hypothetical protein